MSAAPPKSVPPPPTPLLQCKIELPMVGGGDEQYGGTRTINSAYTFSVDKQIGEGTYGQVFLGNEKAGRHDRVALKKIRMDTEKEGFPITAIREIKILSRLQHENVVNLREIVRSELHKNNNFKGSIYMVFDYCEYDLTGLMETVKFKFTEPQVKCIMKQLLKGLAYVHGNGVLHRDLKASNILIDKCGVVKLADFGLARTYQTKQDSRLTNRVITLWYRPPELLLGADKYGPEIDMWSVGCIFAELLVGKPIFPGNDETDQTDKIFKLLGTPTEQTWKGVSTLPHWDKVPQNKYKGSQLKKWLKEVAQKNGVASNVKDEAITLLEKMLCLNPASRIGAVDAFQDDWFWKVEPMPCDPAHLPCHGSSHEYTMKQRRNEQKERQQQHPHPGPSGHHQGPPGGGPMPGRGMPPGGQRGAPGPHVPPPYAGQPDPKRGRYTGPGGAGPQQGPPPAAGAMQGRGGPYPPQHPPAPGYGGRGPAPPTGGAPPFQSGVRPPAPFGSAGGGGYHSAPPPTGGYNNYQQQPPPGFQAGGGMGYGPPGGPGGSAPPGPGGYGGPQSRPPPGGYPPPHPSAPAWPQKR